MNPVFNERRLETLTTEHGAETMTLNGAVGKTALLTLICFASAAVAWQLAPAYPALMFPVSAGAAILGLVLVLISTFAPKTSPVIAPIYAIVEGAFVGVISMWMNQASQGIVMQAVILTFGILFAMLGLYQSRLIRVTEKFRAVIVSATLGIALFYIIALALRFFGVSVSLLHDSSWMGYGLSLFVIAIAAFNFLLDFDLMERLSEANAPKYYESFCALGFLVTLIWLYLEVLRLLARSRD